MDNKRSIIEELREDIFWLCRGESSSLTYDTINLGILRKALESVGFEENPESWDTNGWEMDFWINFQKEEKILSVTGSFYYGNIEIRNNE